MVSNRKYKFTTTKEYVDAFPCAYRQHRAGTHCEKIHGYAFSMKFYFGSDDQDVRGWGGVDYGGLKELKVFLEQLFDHTLLVATDDPEIELYREMQQRGICKLTELPGLGCENIADYLYRYINGVYIPDVLGSGAAERTWCYCVEIRETQSNMAFRTGHREDDEDLFEVF